MPKFKDVSKSVKDLLGLNSGWGCDEVSVNYKFKASNGVKVEFEGVKSGDGISFTNESEYTTAAGITLVEKFQSENKITLTAKTKGKFVKGLNVAVDGVFLTSGGLCPKKQYTVKADYKLGKAGVVDTKFNKGTLTTGVAYQVDNWVVGASFVNESNPQPKSYEVTVGYLASDVAVTSSVKDGSKIQATLFHSPSAAVKAGMVWDYNADTKASKVHVGASYDLDGDATVKGMLEAGKTQDLSLCYTQQLRKEVELELKTKVDVKKLSGGDHTFGVGLSFSS
jgi:voltage-dependent anion channel protein 2